MNYLTITAPFPLEGGGELSEVRIAYTTLGKLATDQSNVVWIFHALTGDANPTAWWSGLVGPRKGDRSGPPLYRVCKHAGLLLWEYLCR
jgi:homoserine O-acetyltransferase